MKKNYYTTILLFLLTAVSANAQQTVGMFTNDPGSLDGYVLFSPISSNNSYLIDKCGKRVHQWPSAYNPGLSVFLLADGSLLRTGSVHNTTFNGNGSSGGIIEKMDWNGNITWTYTLSTTTEMQNHDIYRMPMEIYSP